MNGEAGESASGWRRVLSVFGVVALVLVVFAEPAFGDAQFYYRDASRLFLPLRRFLVDELAAGRLPLWFPYESLGIPGFAQLVPGHLHPLNLVYLLAPFDRAFALNHVLAFVLAGVGAFLLAGRSTGSVGAFVAGVVFALCGAISSHSNLQYLVANATVPLAVYAVDRFRCAPTPLGLLGAAVAVSCVLFAGDPQSVLFAAAFATALAVGEASPGRRVRQVGFVGLAFVASGAVAAVQLVPAAVAFLGSARLDYANASHEVWSLPPLRLLELVAVNPFEEGRWPDPLYPYAYPDVPAGDAWSPQLAIGVGAFLLALAGAMRSRRSLAIAMVGAGSLWVALGPAFGLEELLRRFVPLWGGFQYPEKAMAFASLAFALLAGDGLERVRSGFGLRAVGLGTAGIGLALGGTWIALRGAEGLGAEVLGNFVQGLGVSFAIAVVVTVALLAPVRRRLGRGLVPLLVATVVLPLIQLAAARPPWLDTSTLLETPWAAKTLLASAEVAPPRMHAMILNQDESRRVATFVENQWIAAQSLETGYPATWGIEQFAPYQPAQSATMLALNAVPANRLVSRVLPIFGVEYLVTPSKAVDPPRNWIELARSDAAPVRVLRSERALPRTFVARSLVAVPSGQGSAEALLAPTFFPADQVLAECPLEPGDEEVRDRGHARLVEWTPQGAVVEAAMRERGMLVLNEAYWPGWVARVDGRALPLCRVNALVRGVRLGPGRHTVRFSYEPPEVRLGAALTLVSLLGLTAAVLVGRRRAKRQPLG